MAQVEKAQVEKELLLSDELRSPSGSEEVASSTFEAPEVFRSAPGSSDPHHLWVKFAGSSWYRCWMFLKGSICLGCLLSVAVAPMIPLYYASRNHRSKLGMLCPILSLAVFFSPIPLLRNALARKSHEDIPIDFFAIQSVANLLSVDYGRKINNKAVIVTNLVGVLVQLVWMTTYHYVAHGNTKWLKFLSNVVGVSALCLWLCTFLSEAAVGMAVTGVNFFLFSTPILKMRSVLDLKDASSIPLSITGMLTICNFAWSILGFVENDLVVWVPSVIGYILSIFNIFVWLWCRNRLPIDLSFLLMLYPSTKLDRKSSNAVSKEMSTQAASSPAVKP